MSDILAMNPATPDKKSATPEQVTAGEKTTGRNHQAQIQHRQLARQMAVQALFEVDSVGHKPGDVVDARLANPQPNDNGRRSRSGRERARLGDYLALAGQRRHRQSR